VSQQELEARTKILQEQANVAAKDAERMQKKGLSPAYDEGVRDGIMIALRALKVGV